MINYEILSTGDLTLLQTFSSPVVYLDHWALRLFSSNPDLSKQLINAIKGSNGSLALSWLNLAEFTKITDASQAQAAEQLVNDLIPNLYFLEVNPFTVMGIENQLLNGAPPAPPHADQDFLKAFSLLPSNGLSLFTANGLFEVIVQNGGAVRIDKLADIIVERIEAMREELNADPEKEKLVLGSPRGPERQTGTLQILRELLRNFFADRTIKVTRNHAIDFMHAVVPSAYCDYVLLDRHWEDQVKRMAKKMRDNGFEFAVAQSFSQKESGVENFLKSIGNM